MSSIVEKYSLNNVLLTLLFDKLLSAKIVLWCREPK